MKQPRPGFDTGTFEQPKEMGSKVCVCPTVGGHRGLPISFVDHVDIVFTRVRLCLLKVWPQLWEKRHRAGCTIAMMFRLWRLNGYTFLRILNQELMKPSD
ncbi:MAG: hypothetical protein SGI77_01760 [Pirellulaceae bacterium]|nr:hypothetical protein [Pirellulaceae bacterium]